MTEEPLDYYENCIQRQRNQGLFTADQQIEANGGATSTRQNPNGNGRRRGNQRHGLECPEAGSCELRRVGPFQERDYYPYWHPTPWHDIAILTDEPQERCEYYRMESQNVMPKGYCSDPEQLGRILRCVSLSSSARYNNPDACTGNGGDWKEQDAFNEPPPECTGGIQSRDNHNGNVRNGHPQL